MNKQQQQQDVAVVGGASVVEVLKFAAKNGAKMFTSSHAPTNESYRGTPSSTSYSHSTSLVRECKSPTTSNPSASFSTVNS